MSIITGESAILWFGGKEDSVWATSDFALNFSRGTVEQPLVGEKGNYYLQGALNIDGSLTNCRFGASGNSEFLDSIVDGTVLDISGAVDGSSSLVWHFVSSQVIGYNVSVGDASTITEVSIDFTVMNPKNATYASQKVTC